MGLKVSKNTRRELLMSLQPEYRRASWKEKQRLLDNFVVATGYERKYATVLLNRDVAKDHPQKRERKRVYGEDIREALLTVWKKAANRICSKRLVPILPTLLEKMEEFGHLQLSEEQKKKLGSLSAATVDRLLKPERQKYGRGRSRTKPGYLIKRQIAVRTFADWNDVKPGFIEADLVAHCGESVHGQFLNTLTMTDIETTWTETSALLRRSEADVMNALSEVHQLFPFPFLGLDTDNGGEFINYTLLGWCEENGITFTRSREYKKNDQAHVEEKNGSVVRRLIGYDRYEGVESWKLLSMLYRVARLYINFFQPTMKLLSKSRDGAHVYRKYDRASTPYARVLKSSSVSAENKEQLRRTYKELDPVLLLGEIERIQNEFWATAIKPGEPQPLPDASLVPTEPAQPKPERQRPRRKRKGSRSPTTLLPGRKRGRKTNLDEVWPEVLQELETEPTMSPGKILSFLDERYPGKFRRTQINTIYDKLRRWHHEKFPDSTWVKRRPGRKSVIDDLWPEILEELEKDPNHTARGLMSLLCRRYPGKVRMTQRSTLMQKLSKWRKSHIQSISILPESESGLIVSHASTAERHVDSLQ
jgi:hypothetical protein